MITLLPLLGAWHLRYPSYNAASVLELTRAANPEVLVLAPLPPGALETPAWQATDEIALPLSVVPWALRRGVRLEAGLMPSPDPAAEADFRRYAALYPQTQSLVRGLEQQLAPLDELLPQPLSLARIWGEVIPLIGAYQQAREDALADGPATDWWRERTAELAARIHTFSEQRVVVLASAEQLPFLQQALSEDGLELPQTAPVNERTRERALLDIAFRGDAADPGSLIGQLRALEVPEARFHEANLLLAHGHLAEALELLEAAARGDFSAPYYLPGYLLARLGQLRDLTGDRRGALRAYRGVLALDWVPPEALEAAQNGLAAAFEGVLESPGP